MTIRFLLAAIFTIPIVAQAVPIVVEPGGHLDVGSATDSITLLEGASLSVSDGADTGRILAERSNAISITGGTVEGVYQNSSGWHDINVSGGDIGATALEGVDLLISGGAFDTIEMQDAYGEITGGIFNGAYGTTENSCYAPASIGFCIHTESLVTISGGIFNTDIGLVTTPNITDGWFSYGLIFEGYGLSLDFIGQVHDRDAYRLTGRLSDGNDIDTTIFGIRPYDFLQRFEGGANEIRLVQAPEPGTLALLAIGLFGMARFGKRQPISSAKSFQI